MDKMNQMEMSDEFCKKVLRIKPVLAYLLHECVEEFDGLSIEEIVEILSRDNKSQVIQELNTEDIEVSEARIIYDIMTKVTNGKEEVIIHLEPQGRIRSEYPLMKREIYNNARLISRQKKPYGFQKSDFKNLKKCYSIWVVINAPEAMRGIHNLYRTHETQLRGNHKEKEMNYDLQSIVLLCLTNKIDVKDKSAVMMLSVLLSSQMTMEEKVFILKEEYGIMMTEEDEKEVAVMSEVGLGYYYNGLETGIEQGIELGENKGRTEMLAENVLVLMQNMQINVETAMKLLNVAEDMKSEILDFLNNGHFLNEV